MSAALLQVRDLRVRRAGPMDDAPDLVAGVDLTLDVGESVAVVGESGSGKTLTARAVLGLLPPGLAATGSITVAGERVDADPRRAAPLRGRTMSLLMQDPFTLLNPLRKVGAQIADSLSGDAAANAHAEVTRRLAEVGLGPEVARRFPFQLSGGMRQRVGIAAALAQDPALLIADEPTTALDVTTQREVLRLVRRIQASRSMGFLLITHDLRVAFSMCERVVVMRQGEIVETGPSAAVRIDPQHPYTRALLEAEPSLTPDAGDDVPGTAGTAAVPVVQAAPGLAAQAAPVQAAPIHVASVPTTPVPAPLLLRTDGLTKRYPGGATAALDGLALTVHEGESVGVVGESGSGKTTLARCVVGLETPSSGTISLAGRSFGSWATLSRRERRQLRGEVQMVFQDPYSSLNPMLSVGTMLAEVLRAMGRPARATDVTDLLARVGLGEHHAARRPAALSGGQRQRVAIARAMAARPRLLVCDEAVSALDVSVQAQILELLDDLRTESGTALLFVTHDLAVARQSTDRVYVMKGGHCVESGPTERVLTAPQDDYTRALIAAVPQDDPAWLDEDDKAL